MLSNIRTIVSLLMDGGNGCSRGNPVDQRCRLLPEFFSLFFSFSRPSVALFTFSLDFVRPIRIPQRFFFFVELLLEVELTSVEVSPTLSNVLFGDVVEFLFMMKVFVRLIVIGEDVREFVVAFRMLFVSFRLVCGFVLDLAAMFA